MFKRTALNVKRCSFSSKTKCCVKSTYNVPLLPIPRSILRRFCPILLELAFVPPVFRFYFIIAIYIGLTSSLYNDSSAWSSFCACVSVARHYNRYGHKGTELWPYSLWGANSFLVYAGQLAAGNSHVYCFLLDSFTLLQGFFFFPLSSWEVHRVFNGGLGPSRWRNIGDAVDWI